MITEIKLNYEVIVPKVKFAHLNKNNTLDDYKNEVEKGDWDYQDCLVKKIVYTNQEDWAILTDSFLEDNILWEAMGGHELTKNDKAKFRNKFPDDFKKKLFHEMSEKAKDFFKANCKAETIELINNDTGETIYINPEGHNYARYVGVNC